MASKYRAFHRGASAVRRLYAARGDVEPTVDTTLKTMCGNHLARIGTIESERAPNEPTGTPTSPDNESPRPLTLWRYGRAPDEVC